MLKSTTTFMSSPWFATRCSLKSPAAVILPYHGRFRMSAAIEPVANASGERVASARLRTLPEIESGISAARFSAISPDAASTNVRVDFRVTLTRNTAHS